jgi:hypothetical protein
MAWCLARIILLCTGKTVTLSLPPGLTLLGSGHFFAQMSPVRFGGLLPFVQKSAFFGLLPM